MRTYLIAFLLAAVVTVVITPLVRKLAPRMGAVDLPSGRRVNKRVIPRLGGIAILLGFFAPLAGLLFTENDLAIHFQNNLSRACAALGGALAMSLLGVVDDLRGLRARYKLAIQLAVAVGAWAAGFRIDEISLPLIGTFDTTLLSLPLTVLWIVGIINAVNLIDGLDGLAAGVALMVCVVNFVVGFISDHLLVAVFSSALGGALLGFLVFNFNPARIFMGDSGSMFIGYVLATTSLVGSKGSTAVALVVPIIALGVPIMDTLWAIARRIAARRPIFAPDGEHIHHRLVKRGFTHRRAVLVLYGVSLVLTVAALVVYIGRDWQIGAVLSVSAVVIFGLVRAVSAFQFRAIRREQRDGRYGEDTERIRSALPNLFDDMRSADSVDDVKVALERFGRAAELELIDCRESGLPGLADWAWERGPNGEGGGGATSRVRDYVSAKFPLSSSTIKFGWISDSGDVSPQSEVLLQFVVDMLVRRLPELRSCKQIGERVISKIGQ